MNVMPVVVHVLLLTTIIESVEKSCGSSSHDCLAYTLLAILQVGKKCISQSILLPDPLVLPCPPLHTVYAMYCTVLSNVTELILSLVERHKRHKNRAFTNLTLTHRAVHDNPQPPQITAGQDSI